jgi:glyoxylase I family protein
MEPKDIVIASEPPYPARIGFCIGPVGEEVEFFCVK